MFTSLELGRSVIFLSWFDIKFDVASEINNILNLEWSTRELRDTHEKSVSSKNNKEPLISKNMVS